MATWNVFEQFWGCEDEGIGGIVEKRRIGEVKAEYQEKAKKDAQRRWPGRWLFVEKMKGHQQCLK